MGNAIYGTRLSHRQLFDLMETFYASDHSAAQTAALRQVLLNVTSFTKHVRDTSHEYALFTNLRLREMFSPERKEQTKSLLK